MIVDSHAHIFPFLGAPAGFASVGEKLRVLQFYVAGHAQPVRRLDDHSVVPERGLADMPLDGPHRLHDVGFHVEENGRFVWRTNGVDVYTHFMPPSLQTNACPAELLLAEMAYADVDVAVLQNAHLYGRLNEYFAAAVARYPAKFVALAEVDEVNADREAELRDLRAAVRELGMRGLYYANRAFFFDGYRHQLDHPRYGVFWETVRELRIPVFFEVAGWPVNTPETFVREIARLNAWAARHPDIPAVYTHGIPPAYLEGNVAEPIAELLANEQFLVEILYPIGWGRTHDYPYPELEGPIRELYRLVGGQRLVMGSDMPNVQRHCTYRQAMDYLRKSAGWIPSSDIELIMGGNLARSFGLR